MDSNTTVRKNIYFPVYLIDEVNKMCKEMDLDFSKFVRRATEEYLEQIKGEKLRKELAEGYKEKAGLNKKIIKEFKFVDGESIP
jgi:metal-responsive CopG/Arc/MetJ family transcriptional regulator